MAEQPTPRRAQRFNELLLSLPSVLAICAIAIIPIAPIAEAHWFPAVSKMSVEVLEERPEGLLVHVEFEKLRACEYVGVTFYDGPERLVVDFNPNSGLFPENRPTGPQEDIWFIRTTTPLTSLRAVTEHACHPLWNISREVYP